jgi:uncharacterized protein (UPF0216 family)
MKKAESEIRTLFDKYNAELEKKQKDITDKLTKWGNTLIHRIEDHVAKQKKFLDEHCEKRKRFFETERKKITAEVTTTFEKKKEIEQIDQLLAQCKHLRLNLPVLEQYDVSTSYMRVSTEVALPLKESDKNDAQQTKKKQFQDTIAEDHNNDSGNSASGSRRSSIKPSSAKDKPPRYSYINMSAFCLLFIFSI